MTGSSPQTTNSISETDTLQDRFRCVYLSSATFLNYVMMTYKCSYEKVNKVYYALVILMPYKNSNVERHSGRKRGITGARTELGLYFTVCESFFA